ncbi:MAG: methyltransferase [Erythrobacter sp.]|nr:methyltransferase [Erythrobacter sp.]MBA4051441.1 methyltransferase [Erythrobacter sp.]MBA4163784.1 methyltransferase [Erythrobacter sp.]
MVATKMNFVSPYALETPSIFYPGRGKTQVYNESYAHFDVVVEDFYKSGQAASIDLQGFQVEEAPTKLRDFNDPSAITSVYYDEVIALVKKVTGATEAFVFDHTIRRGQPSIAHKPAQHVHNDYTHTSAPVRAAERLGEETMQRLAGKRMVQVNVWRSINGVVRQLPLAFMDARSLELDDLVRTEIRYSDSGHVGEIYGVRHRPTQRWYFFPEMTGDQVALIKGFDSKTDGVARFTPHTAFELQENDPQAPPRESIEVRTFAFIDA